MAPTSNAQNKTAKVGSQKEQSGNQVANNKSQKAQSTATGSTAAPYNAEEKGWLKEHWKGEFHFLQSNQLSIYDEEEREEGRRIMRAMAERDEGI